MIWYLISGITVAVLLLALCYYTGKETAKMSSQFRHDVKKHERRGS